jgi:aspartyl-tRNA(Asn)/glutamyl-tRNA(Gln) amidotransferase subunit C
LPIDQAEVRRIARLAQLETDAAEVEALRGDLERILDYVALLDELEIEEPTGAADVHRLEPRSRDDEPTGSVGRDAATANAPEAAEGHFRVPRVLDE